MKEGVRKLEEREQLKKQKLAEYDENEKFIKAMKEVESKAQSWLEGTVMYSWVGIALSTPKKLLENCDVWTLAIYKIKNLHYITKM